MLFAVIALLLLLNTSLGAIASKLGVEMKIPKFFVFHGDPASWLLVWLSMAVVSAGLIPVYDFVFESARAKRLEGVKNTGLIPSLALLESRPTNREVYRRYWRRLREDQRDEMLIKDVPLWFVAPPAPDGYEVTTLPVHQSPISLICLEERAARVGLDWHAYLKWREDRAKSLVFR